MKHTAKYFLVAVGAGAAGILIALGSIGYFSQKQEQKVVPEVLTQETQKTVEAPKQEVVTQQSSGVTWLPMPERISGDLDLVKIEKKPEDQLNGEDFTGVEYFKTGSKNGKSIILGKIISVCYFEGACEHDIALFEQQANGYALIVKSSSPTLFLDGVNFESKLTKNVTFIDRFIEYKELSAPKEFEYEGATFVSYEAGIGLIPQADFYKNMTKFTDVTFGTLHSLVKAIPALPGAALQTYYLRKPNGMTVEYNYTPTIAGDDFVLQARWNDGSKNTETYDRISTGGCGLGSSGTPILQSNSLDTLVKTGTTPFGPVYEFQDSNNPLFSI